MGLLMNVHAKPLTEGNLYRQLIALAIPLMAGNILQQLYNLIDALVIAHFAGTIEFSAIGVAGTVMNFFLFAIVGTCNGFSVLFSQKYGAEEYPGFRKVHFCTLVMGLAITAVLSCIGWVYLGDILDIMRTPSELQESVLSYLAWILFSLPATFFYNFYAAILRAIGNTRTALVILAVSIGVNLILDLLLVAGLRWGIGGAAIATAITQAFSAFLCFAYLLHSHQELFARKEDCYFDRKTIAISFRFGSVTALHQSGLYLGKMAIQAAVNSCGTDMIAAFTAASRIESFSNSFGDSNASATAILIGQNYGAGKDKRVEKAYRSSLKLMAGIGLICAVLLAASAEITVGWMLGADDGIAFQSAVSYLKTIAVFYIFCFTGNTMVGYYNGIGKISIPFIGSTVHIVLRVIQTWMMIQRFGLNAVAIATGFGWILINLFWGILRHFYICPQSDP